MNKQNFYDLNFDQLRNFLIEKGEIEDKKAKMRAQQMFNAVYKKNIKNFDELTTFGLELREKISRLGFRLLEPNLVAGDLDRRVAVARTNELADAEARVHTL